MMRMRSRSFVLAIAIAAGACRPSAAASGDASTRASAPDAGSALEGGTSVAAGAPDTGAPSDAENLPPATSDELTLRARHLFEAIVQDDPDLGVDMLFPRDAWILSRDATDPGKQWDGKVAPAFRRAVHALHRRTKGIEHAQLVSFEIGRTVVQATPRRKEWTMPLWDVHHAHLTFTLDGRTMRWDVSELAAWRGAWYVTKLR